MPLSRFGWDDRKNMAKACIGADPSCNFIKNDSVITDGTATYLSRISEGSDGVYMLAVGSAVYTFAVTRAFRASGGTIQFFGGIWGTETAVRMIGSGSERYLEFFNGTGSDLAAGELILVRLA